ncbi:MAG: hypothetical protein ABTA16_12895, partial [Niallia sp.]
RDKATNFHETRTMMYFRPSEYIEIAGGRYTNLPDKVEYSAENFLQVFEEAVQGQLKKTTKSVEEIKVDEEKVRQEKVEELTDKLENDPTEILSQIDEVINGMTREQKTLAASKFKEKFGVNNYKQEAGNIENLKIALEIVNEIK